MFKGDFQYIAILNACIGFKNKKWNKNVITTNEYLFVVRWTFKYWQIAEYLKNKLASALSLAAILLFVTPPNYRLTRITSAYNHNSSNICEIKIRR